MRCSNCGAENQSGNFCMVCGSPLAYSRPVPPPVQSKPPVSTLVMAIVAFCVCLPLGIPATILMVHSRDAFYTGDLQTFSDKNRSSRTCAIVGFVLVGLLVVAYVALWLLMFVGIAMARNY